MTLSILLKSGTLLVPSPGKSANKIEARKADLLISGSSITQIEDSIDTSSLVGVEVLDCTDKIISPGFIDTHRHAWQTQYKGRYPNATLLEYIPRGNMAASFYEPDNIYWGTLAGLLESVDAGVTTIVDHAHMQYSSEHARKGIAAHVDSGVRSTYAYCPTTVVKSWKPALTTEQNFLAPWVMETFEQLGKEAPFGENGRVRLGFAFDALFLPDEVIKNIFATARSNGAQLVTLHYVNNSPVITSNAAVEKLYRLSLLQSDILISHANGITDVEASLLQDSNAHISVTPGTELNMALGDTIPSTNPSLCSHEHVSLGIDCHSYMAAEMFSQMRLLLSDVRSAQSRPITTAGGHPKSMNFSVEDAFLIATQGGANAVGMGSEIGSLQVGRRADIVIFDTSSPAMIVAAENDPVAAIVLHASVRDVETVIIDGRVRKRGGKLLPLSSGQSWKDVSAKVKQSTEVVLKRAEGLDYEVATERVIQLFGIDKMKLV